MSKNNGGPAFPGGVNEIYTDLDAGQPTQEGMTLRDYFAAKAMNGMIYSAFRYLTEHPDQGLKPLTDEAHQMLQDIGLSAYSMADAMLAARDK